MKRFLLLSLVLVGVVSCEKLANFENDKAIVFKNSVSQKIMTKANKGIIENNTFSYDDFGVYGYVEEGALTNGGYLAKNAKYVKSGDIWVPADGKNYYWPKADNVSDINVNFVAYTPHVSNDSFNDDEVIIPIVATEMNEDCVDVLYAHKEDVNPTGEPVELRFNHALSWIEFKGKYAKNVKSVTITSIEFSSALKGKANMVLGVKDFSQSIDDLSYDITPNFGDNIALTAHDDGTGESDYQILSDMLVIPQDVPDSVKITFNITIENATGDEIYYNGRTITRVVNDGPDANKQNDSATGRDFVSEFEGGKKYVYRIYVTADEITFDVDVDVWDEENPFQIWDHNATAYVERFFGKASMQKERSLVTA